MLCLWEVDSREIQLENHVNEGRRDDVPFVMSLTLESHLFFESRGITRLKRRKRRDIHTLIIVLGLLFLHCFGWGYCWRAFRRRRLLNFRGRTFFHDSSVFFQSFSFRLRSQEEQEQIKRRITFHFIWFLNEQEWSNVFISYDDSSKDGSKGSEDRGETMMNTKARLRRTRRGSRDEFTKCKQWLLWIWRWRRKWRTNSFHLRHLQRFGEMKRDFQEGNSDITSGLEKLQPQQQPSDEEAKTNEESHESVSFSSKEFDQKFLFFSFNLFLQSDQHLNWVYSVRCRLTHSVCPSVNVVQWNTVSSANKYSQDRVTQSGSLVTRTSKEGECG